MDLQRAWALFFTGLGKMSRAALWDDDIAVYVDCNGDYRKLSMC